MSEDDWKGWARAARKEAKGITKVRSLNEKGQGQNRGEERARNPWQGVNQLLAQVYYYTANITLHTRGIACLYTSQQTKKLINHKQDMPSLLPAGFSHES